MPGLESQTNMKSSSLIVCKSSDDLTVQAADIVAKCAKEAIEERGRFLIALSGGTTPRKRTGKLPNLT